MEALRTRYLAGYGLAAIVALIALALWPAASAAMTSPPVRWLGVSLDFPLPTVGLVPSPDATRFVVYRERRGEVVLRDTRAHAVVRVPVAETCVPMSFWRGNVLLECGDFPSTDPKVLVVASRQVLDVPGAHPTDEYMFVGRYWLVGQACPSGPGRCGPVHLNWRTGERRITRQGAPPLDADTEDLAPAARPPLLPRARVSAGRVVVEFANGRRLVLGRCRLEFGCSVSQLRANLVVWASTSGRVRAYDLRRHRYYFWRLPSVPEVIATPYEVVFYLRASSAVSRGHMYAARVG